MKKTLVALAVLAASGASFAQVTLSGSTAFGYRALSAPAGDSSGLGFDDSTINFDAVDDLGGGSKVTARLAMFGLDRSGGSQAYTTGTSYATGTNGAVVGQNANITLTTPMFMLQLAANKNADYLHQGIAGAGSTASTYYYNGDGNLWSRARRDQVTVGTQLGAVSVGVSHQEGGNALGLGLGGTGATTAQQRVNALSVGYAAGAIAANAQYLAYDNRVDNSETSAKDTVRLAGSYDLGVAKIGAGIENTSYTFGNTSNRTLVGVNVPLGAFSVGAQWASIKTDGSATAANNGTKSGYTIGGAYALSKRTSVYANMQRYDGAINPTAASTTYALLLGTSF
jgi:hypothetical protein